MLFSSTDFFFDKTTLGGGTSKQILVKSPINCTKIKASSKQQQFRSDKSSQIVVKLQLGNLQS